MKAAVIDFFTPNKAWRTKAMLGAIVGWLLLGLAFWLTRSPLVPRPMEMFGAFPHLMDKGLIGNLVTSLILNIEALVLTVVITLGLSYLTVLPWMRPFVAGVSKLRFLGLTGLSFFFEIAVSGHSLKLAILVYSMTVYFLTSMVDVVASIPKEEFDYARTLRMGEWRVVWSVVVRGTADQAFDVIRQNAAIGWMMLTMVEAMVRTQGGIGTLLLNEDKHLKLPPIAALLLVVTAVGLCFDAVIAGMKKLVCPYAALKRERK